MTRERALLAELSYALRPVDSLRRIVFDSALRSRLGALKAGDTVLILASSQAAFESLMPVLADYPHLIHESRVVNPPVFDGDSGDSPFRYMWDAPESWTRLAMTDRWARILAALDYAAAQPDDGWLILPAHDAVFGHDLLPRLIAFGHEHAQNGLPAAVSPWPAVHHAPVRGAKIDRQIIRALNATFNRDDSFRHKLEANISHQFWGKCGLIPFGMCAAIRQRVLTQVWEDDAEIDAAIRDAGFRARSLWISDPRDYHQAPPVFDRADLYRVIERHLHYAIHGGSAFTAPLSDRARKHLERDSGWRAANALTEAVIAEAQAVLQRRLDQFGASWVDWGAYRIVARPRDAFVEVWQRDSSNLK